MNDPLALIANPKPAILHVDGCAGSRQAMAAMLPEERCRLTGVASFAEAVKLFQAGCFDMVLLDDRNGDVAPAAAIDRLRAIEARKGAPPAYFVVLTERAERGREQQEYAACDAALFRPLTQAALLKTIDAYVRPGFGEALIIRIPRIFDELVPLYIEHRRTEVNLLTKALAEGNQSVLWEIGHKMRGSGASYGMPPITVIGTRLEYAAKHGDLDGACVAVAMLISFLEHVQVALEAD